MAKNYNYYNGRHEVKDLVQKFSLGCTRMEHEESEPMLGYVVFEKKSFFKRLQYPKCSYDQEKVAEHIQSKWQLLPMHREKKFKYVFHNPPADMCTQFFLIA